MTSFPQGIQGKAERLSPWMFFLCRFALLRGDSLREWSTRLFFPAAAADAYGLSAIISRRNSTLLPTSIPAGNLILEF